MRRVRNMLVAAVLAVGMIGTAVPAAQADTSPGNPGTTFNIPGPWGGYAAHYRIVNKIIAAINNTYPTPGDPKPTILLTSYLFDRPAATDAIINACKRGVGVQVILDHAISNKTASRMISALNGDNTDGTGRRTGACGEPLPTAPANVTTTGQDGTSSPEVQMMGTNELNSSLNATEAGWGGDRSYAYQCKGACRGPNDLANMHAKFYAFSSIGNPKTDDAAAIKHDVVMVSSSNINDGGALKGWNDMYTMPGNSAVFDYYRNIHNQMRQDVAQDRSRAANEFTVGNYTSRFFPMRVGMDSDPTYQDLQKIGCRSAFGRTQVRISMFYWADKRGLNLANKVYDLAKQGCDVRVVYGAPGKDVRLKLRDASRRFGAQIFDSRSDYNPKTGQYQLRTHGKWVAVKGAYDGNRSAYQVNTGTQNWVWGSLNQGDENSLNISNERRTYDAYNAEFAMIAKHSRRVR